MDTLQRSGISGMVRLSESAGRSIAATQRWEMERLLPCTKRIVPMLESTGKFISDSVCGVLPVFLYVDNNFLGVMARFFVSDLRTVMIALIVVKASVSEKKSNWKELVFEIGLIAVFLAVKNRNGQEILLDTLLLILGAKEIASEKLIRVYTVTIATALL